MVLYKNRVIDNFYYRMDDDDDINRLRRYKEFRTLTSEEKDKIFKFCTVYAPNILENKCIFQNDSMCHEHLVSKIRIIFQKRAIIPDPHF